MSEGLKVGLILGGVGVVGYFLWKNSQAATLGSLGAAAPTSALGAAPGQPLAPNPSFVGAVAQQTMAPAASAGTSSGGGSSLVGGVAKLAVAPIVVPTLLAVKAGQAVGSGVVSAGKTVASAASGVVHALGSIF